jgi:hypothetical protein
MGCRPHLIFIREGFARDAASGTEGLRTLRWSRMDSKFQFGDALSHRNSSIGLLEADARSDASAAPTLSACERKMDRPQPGRSPETAGVSRGTEISTPFPSSKESCEPSVPLCEKSSRGPRRPGKKALRVAHTRTPRSRLMQLASQERALSSASRNARRGNTRRDRSFPFTSPHCPLRNYIPRLPGPPAPAIGGSAPLFRARPVSYRPRLALPCQSRQRRADPSQILGEGPSARLLRFRPSVPHRQVARHRGCAW